MGIINLFSKRKKLAEQSGQPEVYQYANFPIAFRRQVIHIWMTSIGCYHQPNRLEMDRDTLTNRIWRDIYSSFTRELGLFELTNQRDNPFIQFQDYLLDNDTSIDNIIDSIKFTFRHIDQVVRMFLQHPSHRYQLNNVTQNPDDAIYELNHRFREHSIGYQFENGQIIRVDSGFIHAEIVKPALYLLNSEGFEGAEEEFRNAHQHYRHQQYKNAIADALKSFESTMKTICDNCGWPYNKNDTAKKLINVILQNQLAPQYLETYLAGLRQVLEAGVPTVRNKTSGHGQGAQPTEVPEYLASYVLHMTASNIVFLVEAYKLKLNR